MTCSLFKWLPFRNQWKCFSHFVAWHNFPLLISNTALCVYNSLTIHQSKGLLIAFYFPAVVNNTAVKHSCASLSVDSFQFIRVNIKSTLWGCRLRLQLADCKSSQTVSQSSHSILPFQQQWMSFPWSSAPFWHLVLSMFGTIPEPP